jgi:hypothetical protein
MDSHPGRFFIDFALRDHQAAGVGPCGFGFSLTPGVDSVILNSLRGVAPGVCVYSPGPGWSMPWRDRLEQAIGG